MSVIPALVPASELTIILMAKAPIPGRVKTRLAASVGNEAAAAIHAAMTACVLRRIKSSFDHSAQVGVPPSIRFSVAWDSPALLDNFANPLKGWHVVPQGDGSLGDRMQRVWSDLGGKAVVFLGCDAPDVPTALMRAAVEGLATNPVMLGRAADGGYWTLAARECHGGLLTGLDWGGPTVYDQTRVAAAALNLSVGDAGLWRDVDTPADLAALRQRLASASDPALVELARALAAICKDSPS